MDSHLIEICHWRRNEDIDVIGNETYPKPLVIQCPVVSSALCIPNQITIEVPKQFQYQSDKKVSWNYGFEVKVNNLIVIDHL